MSFPIIENLLYDAMGLNTTSIGSSAVMRAVEQRMQDCKLGDVDLYTEKLKRDKAELQELVEEVVVAETWFFRDDKPFKMLTRYVTEEWLPENPEKPIRILSLPCATGEEPYSIAITLIEAGLMPSQLKIEAFDISERNIKRCKSAHYREYSFRGVDPYLRDRFFNFNDKFYYPDILIKAMVNFEVASILDTVFIHTQIPYDVVFCRNLLIYFDRKTQATAAKMLNKLLNPAGMLFVGHAESSIFSGEWKISKRYEKSFIVRKFEDGVSEIQNKKKHEILNSGQSNYITQGKSNTQSKNISHNTSSNKSGKIKNSKLNSPRSIVSKRPINVTKPSSLIQTKTEVKKSLISSDLNKNTNLLKDNSLVLAREFADSGKLIEAESICIDYLEKNKQDSEVYYLLGIIQLALGDEQKSAKYFKNVIYLNPEHYDALMYLATLLGDEGDDIAATRFRERAARIKTRLSKVH